MKLKLIVFIFLFSNFAIGQINFEAKVSKAQLGANERLRIEFTMNQNGDHFKPPNFENFVIVGGPSQSIRNYNLNGKRSFSKTYSYVLAPKKKGTFVIGEATIEYKNKTYTSKPITIKVTKDVDIPKNPNDPNYIASQNLHLVAEVSNPNPYLNEAITVVYKLYVSEKIGVDRWNEIESPKYNDFWSQNIDTKIEAKKGNYKGQPYRYVILKKTILYPQKTGELTIEPLKLDVQIDVPGNRRDFFGALQRRAVSKSVTAGSRKINVKPLPTAGRPADFSGAVGDFNFKVSTNKTKLKASEALSATIEVSGKGNLKLFELPELKLPNNLEKYEPEHSEKVSTNLGGMRGKISDNYTIVPSAPGKYPIPPIRFSYFDIKTKRYKTLNSSPIVIDVTDADGNKSFSNNTANTINNKQNVISNTGNKFASFKTKTSFRPIKSNHFFKTNLFWILLLLPLLTIPIVILIKQKQNLKANDIVGNKQRKANKLTKKYLGAAKKSLGNKDEFYNAMERALHNYLKYKLKIETSEMRKEHIEDLLKTKAVTAATISKFNALLKSCELARYSPFSNVEMKHDYNQASAVIAEIDKQIR